MYAKAHNILGILYSYVDDGRYKKRLTQEKNNDTSDILNEPQQGQEQVIQGDDKKNYSNGEVVQK